MEEIKSDVTHIFFAAANSYRGFVSYFDKVFDSKDYKKIYVLKGGPGTGKSSFMKKVSALFSEKNCEIEEIYCSSDPHSLDGVIIRKEGKSVAILDGTAPHERDAVIPGATDEIINLGEGWDSRFLMAQREEIFSIASEKSLGYKTAYNYLKIAGQANEFISNLYSQHFDRFTSKSKAELLLKDIVGDKSGKVTTRFISSFGRYGSFNLNTFERLNPQKICIGGSEYSGGFFLDSCFAVLKEKGVNILHLPCALDPTRTDAIYLPDQKMALIRGEGEINADDFTDLSPTDTERTRMAGRIKADALEEAKRWFAIASDLHFRLEEIYSRAMDFDKNSKMLDKKIREIENML